MSKEQNIQIVKQLYAYVAAKNLEAVFNALTDDIHWAPPYVPEIHHTKPRNGKSGVKAWVIEMASEVTYHKVEPQEIFADNDAVIIKGQFSGTANNTGKSFESDWIHLWKFRDNKICSYKAFWNTATVRDALM